MRDHRSSVPENIVTLSLPLAPCSLEKKKIGHETQSLQPIVHLEKIARKTFFATRALSTLESMQKKKKMQKNLQEVWTAIFCGSDRMLAIGTTRNRAIEKHAESLLISDAGRIKIILHELEDEIGKETESAGVGILVVDCSLLMLLSSFDASAPAYTRL